MKLEKQYVCPKCSWVITEDPVDLRNLKKYTCQVCRNDFSVKVEGRMKPGLIGEDGDENIIFIHRPNDFTDEPLGLPRGSVRATTMILISIATWVLILRNEPVPDYIQSLLIVVVGYYFAIRTTFLGVTSLESGKRNRRIEIEQEPLFLPRGYIRIFIALGFTLCAIHLIFNRDSIEFYYEEFLFILFGLMLGFVIQRATADYHEEGWYWMLGHVKALIVLGIGVSLFFLILFDRLNDFDVWLVRVMIAYVGFYFTSR